MDRMGKNRTSLTNYIENCFIIHKVKSYPEAKAAKIISNQLPMAIAEFSKRAPCPLAPLQKLFCLSDKSIKGLALNFRTKSPGKKRNQTTRYQIFNSIILILKENLRGIRKGELRKKFESARTDNWLIN